MKQLLKRKGLITLILLMLLIGSNMIHAYGFTIGGIDYIRTQGEVVAYGGNLWRDNYSKGTAIFPLSEAWGPVEVGLTEGQPLVIDGIIFTLGDKSLKAINKENGRVLRTYNMPTINPNFNPASLFAIKHSNASYQLIAPSKDGKVVSISVNVVRNSDSSIVGLSFTNHWQFDAVQLNINGERAAQFLTQTVTILKDANSMLDNIYIGFGTYNGHLVVLDSQNGRLATNGSLEFDSILGSSGGIVYRDFADIILSKNNISSGGFVGGVVHNGVLNLRLGVDKQIHSEGIIGPMAYAVIDNISTGGTSGMLVAQDKLGRIIGYNTTENELLFIIDKYQGAASINSIAIAGKYLLVTLAEDGEGRARVVCINYENAIEAAQYDHDKLANSSFVFEELAAAHTYSGAIALSVAEQEFDSFGNIKEVIFREVFLTANRSTDTNESNLQMFYLDQYNSISKRPLPVPYAFQTEELPGVYKTGAGIHIAGGIHSQLSYGGGFLMFVDGKGYLHAYTAVKENNLALVNFENSSDLLERGKTYTAVVDVVNYTGEHQENIPIEYWINEEKIHEGRVNFGPDGITVNFQYTLPMDYEGDSLKLEVRLNMQNPRVLEEITYDDNTATLMMAVAKLEELDLEVTRITHSSFYRGQYGMVNVHVRNNSDKIINNPAVPVRLQIAGTTVQMTERINLGPNGSTTISFRLQVPDALMSFNIIGEINHTRIYEETDYSNNVKQVTANIINPNIISGCIPASTTWTEYRTVSEYSSGAIIANHYEDRFSHYEYYDGPQIGTDSSGNPIYQQISEAIYVPVLVGYTVRFNAQLNASVNVTPKTIKAGYGIEVTANSSVSTNYDKPYKLTNIQNIYVSFPDKATPVMLVPQGNTSSIGTLTWTLPSNSQSVFGERKHYIPVEWADGNYQVKLSLQNAITPADSLCQDVVDTIVISGQMYEDDHTGIR